MPPKIEKVVKILTKKEVSSKIEELVGDGHSYIEAVVLFTEERYLRVEEIIKFLSESIISRLEKEGMERRMLPKKPSLKKYF